MKTHKAIFIIESIIPAMHENSILFCKGLYTKKQVGFPFVTASLVVKNSALGEIKEGESIIITVTM